MPYIKIETNQDMKKDKEFCLKISKVVSAITGKPEKSVMSVLELKKIMALGGDVGPCVFVDYKGINVNEASIPELTKQLSLYISQEMRIPESKIYLNFTSVPANHWGCNGVTF
ncbi:MAG: Macrophage migration inhibitory factor (MIF) [Alphaproteobacteria bacterium ADurb.Bin438]|nr:MAG: Macrophage migration inhibitory factor (MIF) [Alphaproteobacteria bacterium ADurb.Bin438]